MMKPAPNRPPRERFTARSIRARVLLAVVVILAVTMLAAGLAVFTVFDRQARTAGSELLTSRMQLAKQLSRQDLAPRLLVNRIDAQGVRATLTLSDGTRLGADPIPGPQRSATLTGPSKLGGAKLVLTIDTALLDGARSELAAALMITGGIALVVAALLALLGSAVALRPLRAVAGAAQQIAAGQRGIRLRPSNRRSEIGTVADAMDAMLDELEGAEQRALHAQNRALASEQRIREFLADAAHELRTPLTGIAASAETLLHQPLSVEQQQQLLGLLVREARSGSRLVDDLLAMARLDAGPVADAVTVAVDVGEIVRAERARQLMLHPTLTIECVNESAFALADPVAVQAIVRNVLDNGARVAGQHGQIRTTFDMREQVVLDIEDSGSGVPDAQRERIFDRLVRLDTGRKRVDDGGSGLGLAIARAHARANGGDLICLPAWSPELPTRPNALGGAIFRLTLPRVQASSPSIR